MNTITRIHHGLLSITAFAVLSVGASLRAGEVNASLSAREAYVGAPVTLRLEIANSSSHDEPQLPDVAGLDIQSAGLPSRSTQTTISNGRRIDRTSAVYAWRIIPRREGAFVIPGISVQVDGKRETTPPLRFVAAKSETGDLLLAEVTGQQQKIYVGQPLKLTLNLWIKPYRDAEHELTVSEADTWQMISEATNWGPFKDRLTELADNNQRPAGEEVLRKDATGAEHSYYRYQLEATIYPKRPGQIDTDDLQIVVDYPTRLAETRDGFDSMFDSMFDSDFFNSGFPFGNRDISPFRRHTLSIAASRRLVAQATVAPMEVSPIPSTGRPADYRGAVGQYQIVTHAVPLSVKAGDPITLHMGISGDGPMELIQAPPLSELPHLTRDFQVTNEPLAGVVEGDAKLFTTTIRPRRAGISQIPAIPLSSFDPSNEKFVTVHSDPILIEVAPADRLALESIVGAAANPEHRAATTDQPRLDFSNDLGPEVIVSATSPSVWPSPWLVWVPPLVVASLWGFRRRRRLVGLFQGTARDRLRSAQQAVDSARSASDVASAATGYVADYLQRPSAVLTRSEIATGLNSIGCPRGAQQQLDDLLTHCELATYARSENGQLADLKSSASTLLAELSQVPHSRTAARSAHPKDLRRKLVSACLLVSALSVFVSTMATMMVRHLGDSSVMVSRSRPAWTTKTTQADVPVGLSPSQRATILSEANDAYQRGMQASQNDAATAQDSFSTAAAKYQLLLDSGVHNSQLYCNLGNAYLQSGSLGRAIANYERALLLDASNTKAHANLDAARRSVPTVSDSASETLLGHPLQAVTVRLSRFLSPAAGHRLLAATWILVWATAVGVLCLPHRRWHYLLISTISFLGMLFVGAALAGLVPRSEIRGPHGIVAVGTAILRQAPGDNFAAVTNRPLPEGQSLTVLQDRDSWLRVQTPDGQSGWVDSLAIERVDMHWPRGIAAG